jgi:uncharacterized membrane protein
MSAIDQPAAQEDRTMPAVAYGLYLIGLTHGLTIVIAVIIAYAARAGAGPVMRTHYDFIIRTFWLSLAGIVIGAVIAFWGLIFSIVLIGLPFVWLGWTVCGLVWLWALVRLIVGVLALANGQPHPRPYGWLI